MPRRYLAALTTPSVQEVQDQYCSRGSVRRMVAGWDTGAVLGADEIEFVGSRDGSTSAPSARPAGPTSNTAAARPAS
ncbi:MULTISPECIES: hypothetical protein [Amycolatopsis]|uniref:Transposase n=1 Tax=Amycolatopsis tucumanensis TaxID=401106 RepID=A0ABP7HRD8_9PSEU|nr:hypothetical protein [Amycolatopsis tucumanensis]MCF6421361.1 hypothetical protein [Amycolatopsis tucumanensis]